MREFHWRTGETVKNRITALEDTYVKALWFESVSSGTSGVVTLPTGATIILNEWANGVDALASKASGGLPTFETVRTTLLVPITATLDVSGNWTISGTPSAYPISVVYVYKVKLSQLDVTKVLGGVEIVLDASSLDHSSLLKLDYASAGHTGFEPAKSSDDNFVTDVEKAALHASGGDTALGAVETKNPPIDADLVLYRDSTASNGLVTSTWTQVKAFLKTYFDTLYSGPTEGTWTPAVKFGGASSGLTYTFTAGNYVKIGNFVFVTAYISMSAKGSSTGDATIEGLPFTIKNTLNSFTVPALCYYFVSYTGRPQGFVANNTTKILLKELAEDGTCTDLTHANFADNTTIILSMGYVAVT